MTLYTIERQNALLNPACSGSGKLICANCGKYDRNQQYPDGSTYCHRCKMGSRQKSASRTSYVGKAHRPKAEARTNWTAEAERFVAAMTPERLNALAASTGVPAEALAKLSVGWATAEDLRHRMAGGAGWHENYPDGAYTFPERSGDGCIVGFSLRAADGRKGAPAGCERGLIVPANLHELTGPILVVEGASDVAALNAMGVRAVGRPSNSSGGDDVGVLLDCTEFVIVGENDGKPSGAWPGRDGAKSVALKLAVKSGEPVAFTLPPPGVKDVREYLRSRIANGLDVSDGDAMRAAGAELLAAMMATAKYVKPAQRKQADALVDLALEHFRLGLTIEGDAFAVLLNGPNIARLFRGGSSGLRMTLSHLYRQRYGSTPSASALADALMALEGRAQDAEREAVALRVAEMADGTIVIDLGDASGRVVIVNTDNWTIAETSPVLFRRTALTGALPMPEPASPEELQQLRELLNVGDEAWPLIVGYLIAAFFPSIPHCPLMVGGEQGTGKSSAVRLLLGIVDPSPALLRSEPRDAEAWAIAASGSWAICIDNVSAIPAWLADSICKACTGDGIVRRKLYADSDLIVLSFRRLVVLTSIDAGAMRGDLGDRLLLIDLERIAEGRRRTEAELDKAYAAMRGKLLGALLSAVARVVAILPSVERANLPRMADFARILAAIDLACPELTNGRAFALFTGQRQRIAEEVVEGDPVAAAIVNLVAVRGEWIGPAAELLAAITPTPVPRKWPTNARGLSGHLKRVRPALAAVGIAHHGPAPSDKTRTHRLERIGNRPPEPPTPPESDDADAPVAFAAGQLPYPDRPATGQPPADRPTRFPDFEPQTRHVGGSGGVGGTPPLPTVEDERDEYEEVERLAIMEDQ